MEKGTTPNGQCSGQPGTQREISVGGIVLGTAAFSGTGNVDIKFEIDNNPVLRARVLHLKNTKINDVAQKLSDEFKMGHDTGQVLHGEGYDVVDVGMALKTVFFKPPPKTTGYGLQDVAQILKDVGYDATGIGSAMQADFTQGATAAAQILKNIGFDVVSIASSLRDDFGSSPTDVASAARKSIGFSVVDITNALKNSMGQRAKPAALPGF